MDSAALTCLLDDLIATWENEVVEFKQAGDGFSTDDIGKYFSALANEANLRGAERAWLVFGVNNKTRSVVGTDYRPEPGRLQSLKMQITENTEPRITFRDVHELHHANGRVLLLEVPAGRPDEYIAGDKTPRRYRNPFLTQAMAELNMIDTMGWGIHSIYQGQARRYFPLPDYDLSEPSAVKLTLYGGVVDPAYSRLLIQKTDLPLVDVLALDRVQKKLPIPDAAAVALRRAGLIEGRKPNYHVSAQVAAAAADGKAEYIRTRAQDDEFYAKLLTDYLEKFGQADRAEINGLLLGKLSDALTDQQKYNKISSLLTKLRRRGVIRNSGSDKAPCWRLAEKN